jgi:hypothetical protein
VLTAPFRLGNLCVSMFDFRMQTFEAICTANEQHPDGSHIGTLTLPGRSRRPPHPPVDEQIQEDHDEHAEDQQKYFFAGQMAGRKVQMQIHRNPRIFAGLRPSANRASFHFFQSTLLYTPRDAQRQGNLREGLLQNAEERARLVRYFDGIFLC